MKGQKVIVEYMLLAGAALSILVMTSLLFNEINKKIVDEQTVNGLTSIAEQTVHAVTETYEAGKLSKPTFNMTVILDFPSNIGGATYIIFPQTVSKNTCLSEIAIVGLCSGKRVEMCLNKQGINVTGRISSSSSQRAAVTYYSNKNETKLEMV